MIYKVLEDTKCNINIALSWVTNAKNSIQNIHGFSPYQLAIGTNPALPNSLNDRPPAIYHDAANQNNPRQPRCTTFGKKIIHGSRKFQPNPLRSYTQCAHNRREFTQLKIQFTTKDPTVPAGMVPARCSVKMVPKYS